MKDTKEENALLIPSTSDVAQAFETDEAIDAILTLIESECRSEHLSVDTREGRDRIKSLAYKISRSKTAMDEVGKGLTEEAKKLIDTINGRRKMVTTRLDRLKEDIRRPLTEWERQDDARKLAIKDRISNTFVARHLPGDSASLREIQDEVIAVELDETWQEFLEEATKAKDGFLRLLAGKIQDAERAERQAEALQREREELARLRAEEQAREQERQRAAAAQAEKDEEIKRLRAELLAMQQGSLPVSGGISGAAPAVLVTDETPSAPVEKIDMPASGDNFVAVAEFVPVSAAPELSDLALHILSIIEPCEDHVEAADAIAKAILEGQIPNLRFV